MAKEKDPKKPVTEDESKSGLSRRDFLKIASVTAGAVAVSQVPSSVLAAAAPKTKVDTPQISCVLDDLLTEQSEGPTETTIEIKVCAPSGTDATGLPAGFSLQWMTCEEYAEHTDPGPDGILGINPNTGVSDDFQVYNTWYASDDPRLCKASFSGNANLSRYNLEAGSCVTVKVGEFLFDNGASTNCADALDCGTCYVFRAFGHATNRLTRSDFTANKACSTLDCALDCNPPNCTYTQGYWKTHGPTGCQTGNNSNEWPVTSLTLGTVSYTADQLCSILNTAAQGNGLIALAHQLIAAKFNIAKGADPTDAADCIAAADTLIGSLKVPPVGSWACKQGKCTGDYLSPDSTSVLTDCLADYNEGATGPCHCPSNDTTEEQV